MGGDGRRLLGAVFSPEVPSLLPGPRGRGFLTSFVLAPPRPSTRFGSWLVLPGHGRGSEYVCDGPRAAGGRGTPPARPPPLPPGCGTSACPFAGLRVSCLSPTRGGARLVVSQWCSAPRRSADPLGCPPLPARPEPEVVIQRKAGHPIASVGLAVLRILPPLPPRLSCLLVKPVR